MTLKQYEANKKKVEQNWDKYPEWMKYWTREMLKQQLKTIKETN